MAQRAGDKLTLNRQQEKAEKNFFLKGRDLQKRFNLHYLMVLHVELLLIAFVQM